MYSTILTVAMVAAFLNGTATSTTSFDATPTYMVIDNGNWVSATIPVVPEVPFYSQFVDIASSKWKPASCGITSLAMLIEYYKPTTVDVNTLLKEGLAIGAFSSKAGGWTYDGLIEVSQKYGLGGEAYDFANGSSKVALTELRKSLSEGPVMASVHYKFEPKNPIPHIVVVNGIDGDNVYYNDPASKEGGNLSISLKTFLASWKQRFIVVRPVTTETPKVAIR
jgi:predicted double-glycine peptidase